jgi:hypothetical protein
MTDWHTDRMIRRYGFGALVFTTVVVILKVFGA